MENVDWVQWAFDNVQELQMMPVDKRTAELRRRGCRFEAGPGVWANLHHALGNERFIERLSALFLSNGITTQSHLNNFSAGLASYFYQNKDRLPRLIKRQPVKKNWTCESFKEFIEHHPPFKSESDYKKAYNRWNGLLCRHPSWRTMEVQRLIRKLRPGPGNIRLEWPESDRIDLIEKIKKSGLKTKKAILEEFGERIFNYYGYRGKSSWLAQELGLRKYKTAPKSRESNAVSKMKDASNKEIVRAVKDLPTVPVDGITTNLPSSVRQTIHRKNLYFQVNAWHALLHAPDSFLAITVVWEADVSFFATLLEGLIVSGRKQLNETYPQLSSLLCRRTTDDGREFIDVLLPEEEELVGQKAA